VRERAVADDVETVNGGITLEETCACTACPTVNGGIHAGQRVRVQDGREP
jgi:hypothetical protein